MNPEEDKRNDFERAIKAYRKSNSSRWVFAFFCSRVVGKYGFYGTRGLANDMNVSPDTVEDHAHAYWLFDKLRKLNDSSEKLYVQHARKMPYIYIAHFRALYDLQISRNLTDEQIMNLLVDIVQAEGGISSRSLEDHVHSKYGDTRTWEFYAQRTQKELGKLLNQPDFPDEGRSKAQDLFSFLGDRA